jgi:hypothetical protein
MRRPGAFGPAKEDLEVRLTRFRRDLPVEASRWRACEALGITRALLRRREINRQLHRQKLGGADPAVVRGKCASVGKWYETPFPRGHLLTILLQCVGDNQARLRRATVVACGHAPTPFHVPAVDRRARADAPAPVHHACCRRPAPRARRRGWDPDGRAWHDRPGVPLAPPPPPPLLGPYTTKRVR